MLRVNNLTKSFNGRFVINNINYKFPDNEIIALVGVNGAGKTTFFNILCGLEEADGGEVEKSKALTLSYMPQSPNPCPAANVLEECMSGATKLYELKLRLSKVIAEMETTYTEEIHEEFEEVENLYRQNDGYILEGNAEKILLGLGFKAEQFNQNPLHLSGGWRMRLEFAKILLQNPDFLILDEPTNHLDLPSIIWFENYMKKFKGTLLFISHDEDLLNRLPSTILHLKNGKITPYKGNHDDFLRQYEENQASKAAEIKNKEKRIEQLSTFVNKYKAKATKAAQARSKMKIIAKLQNEADNIVVDSSDQEMNIKIPIVQKSGRSVIILENCAIGYEKPLLKSLSLKVERGQRIAVVGANGLGKSTLIKCIHGSVPLLSGEVKIGHNVNMGYYAQEQLEGLNPKNTVLENLMYAGTDTSERQVRSILASFLFRKDDVYKPVSVLSGGEKSRLSLACLLVQKANFLLLDEPTNHLDILSSRILSEAFSEYEGTIIFIGHNRQFINSLATHVLVLQNNKAILTEGNLDNVKLLIE